MADPASPRPDDADAPRGAGEPTPDSGAPDVPPVADAPGAAPTSPAEPTTGTAAQDETPAGPGPVPDEAELERTAEPARVRRAPKMGAFIVTGSLVGIVLGLLLALVTAPGSDVVADGTAFVSVLEGQGVIRFLAALTGGVVGGFAGGGIALLLDRRSLRR